MFTRDIDLQDSILDLLDNCIDGVMRSLKARETQQNTDTPYDGYSAEISFDKDYFRIVDNCGGIPKEILKAQAFRMGRPANTPDEDIATVGMYGIGMKRSIFKMGRSCTVKSFTPEGAYQVKITPEWMSNDSIWELEMEEIEPNGTVGTHIEIRHLLPAISALFAKGEPLHTEFPKKVAYHFSFIIQKGFKVTINSERVVPREFGLLVSPEGTLASNQIAPFLYYGRIDNVEVTIAVGFYREIPNDDELDDEMQMRRSSDDAGWTVVCNDRVVLYNDKTRMTGWGEGTTPSYHTQFIGILGVVFFTSSTPERLPLTTTKRGVDGSSQLYLYVKTIMSRGLKKFTDYTNQWKRNLMEERKISSSAKPLSITKLMEKTSNETLWKDYKPNTPNEKWINLPLPRPEESDPMKQIKFHKRQSEINKVGRKIFGSDQDVKPGEIGEACFQLILESDKI